MICRLEFTNINVLEPYFMIINYKLAMKINRENILNVIESNLTYC